jgi:hypothetical protein
LDIAQDLISELINHPELAEDRKINQSILSICDIQIDC